MSKRAFVLAAAVCLSLTGVARGQAIEAVDLQPTGAPTLVDGAVTFEEVTTTDGNTVALALLETVEKGARRAVQTLTDDSDSIPVEVRGDGADRMVASGVKAYHNIRPGDRLVTSGEAGFLPAAIRIGTVVSVAKAPESPGFVSLQIKPDTDLASLRKVYVVYPLGGRLEEDPRGGRR